MNNEKDLDFRQFNGAFDSPMEPDADFTARLTDRLVQVAPAVQERRSTVIASPSRRSVELPAPRRSHPLFVAAAVLIVFALAAATIFQLAPGAFEEQHSGPPLVTMPANAVATPDVDQQLVSTRLPGLSEISIEAVDGEILYGNAYRPAEGDSTPGFLAYDQRNQEILWQMEGITINQAMIYENRIIGTRITSPAVTQSVDDTQSAYVMPDMAIVSIDRDTGQPRWETPFPSKPDGTHWGQMLIIGDVLIHSGAFSTAGYDASTGDMLWAVDQEPIPLPYSDSHYHISRPLQWNQNLVLIDGNFHGSVINPANGEMISEFEIPLTISELMTSNFDAEADGDLVIVMAYRHASESGGPEIVLIEVNPTSGEIVSNQTYQPGQANSMTYSDRTVAVMVSTWKSNPWYLQLIGRSGYSDTGMVWIDLGTQQEILRTEMVRVDVIAAGTVINTGEIICYQTTEYICIDRSGTRYLTGISEHVRTARLVGNEIYITTEKGVIRIDLP